MTTNCPSHLACLADVQLDDDTRESVVHRIARAAEAQVMRGGMSFADISPKATGISQL